MNNAEITVDTKNVLNLFANLSPKKQNRAIKNALKKGSQILVKETKKQLKSGGIKGATKKHPEWKNISLNTGIKYKVRNDESKVNIMGDFRLKFFELGTAKREYTKNNKTHYTGSIKGLNFFNKAKASKEQEIFSSMNKLLSESIQKIAKRK